MIEECIEIVNPWLLFIKQTLVVWFSLKHKIFTIKNSPYIVATLYSSLATVLNHYTHSRPFALFFFRVSDMSYNKFMQYIQQVIKRKLLKRHV